MLINKDVFNFIERNICIKYHLFCLNHTHNGIQYYIKMINDNNRFIYKHEITVDIITLINSNIINNIVDIIITKTINTQIV